MMALNRVNRMGMKYYIEELYTGVGDSITGTRIKSLDLGKEIVVKHSIQRISQGWYNWVMEGDSIQNAFPFLDASEREFLMTGILDDEWNDMWKDRTTGKENL
jgi:hypothetical protein